MKLILGLGNPGMQYQNTRHNIGFICLDEWARSHKKAFKQDSMFAYIHTPKAVLIKPLTWMNRSGVAAREALRRWDIDQSLVIYDDLELPAGSLRIRNSGTDGGHNGIKSLLEVINGNDLKRFRIGIGREDNSDARDYVLQAPTPAQAEAIQATIGKAVELLDLFIHRDFTAVLNEYSKWKKSYSEGQPSES